MMRIMIDAKETGYYVALWRFTMGGGCNLFRRARHDDVTRVVHSQAINRMLVFVQSRGYRKREREHGINVCSEGSIGI